LKTPPGRIVLPIFSFKPRTIIFYKNISEYSRGDKKKNYRLLFQEKKRIREIVGKSSRDVTAVLR
jgi:hypothetical protein